MFGRKSGGREGEIDVSDFGFLAGSQRLTGDGSSSTT